MGNVLYTSAAVRKAIVDLLARPTARRVVVVAFVGDGAEAYLPHPKGLDLVCCPSPSGTNPNTLRLLRSRGVRVFFSALRGFVWVISALLHDFSPFRFAVGSSSVPSDARTPHPGARTLAAG